ncbi:MAG: flagellar filament capping protein FliD [Gammaproteobacteria bacterium]|nr:flagellar filament capping protein FliD [Gammaproteobacteria bacterium]
MAAVNATDTIGGKITQALKAGSGVDIHELAATLADAETTPQISSITGKKEETTVSLSGFGVLKSSITSLNSSFESLKDRDTFLTKSVTNSNPNDVETAISSQTLAKAGTTRIVVHQLARPEVTEIKTAAEGTFASATASISGLSSITLSSNGSSSTISIATATPAGIVEAINNTNFNGIQARTVNKSTSGTAVTIVLVGKTGSDNSFTVDTNLSGGSELTFQQDQTAANLKLEVNADKISAADSNPQMTERDNNSPTDVVEGVQITFKSASATETRNIVVSSDTAALETKVNNLIDSYNNVISISKYLTGEKDAEDELAGSLSSERNSVNLILSKIRDLVGKTSATASNGFSTLRDLGITTQLSGQLKLNKTNFSAAIKTNFSDIRTMLTADKNDQLKTDSADKGLSLESSIILDGIVDDQGTIGIKETNAQADISRYEDDLADLQERLENIKARYLKQFAAMETIVQRSKNTGEYLTNQFEAMRNSNK